MADAPDPPDAHFPSLRLTLDDGTPVLLRPIVPEDAPLIQQGLERLSTESRISRFFAPLSHLSERQLDYLSHVDQVDHVAWGAIDLSSDGLSRSGGGMLGLGVGRFARIPSEPHVAEVALAVIDAAQRHGLGGLLLGVLYCLARTSGVTTFRAVVMEQNYGLIERLRAIGGVVRYEEGQVVIDVPVVADTDELPSTPTAEELKRVLRTVEAELARASIPRTTRSRPPAAGRS